MSSSLIPVQIVSVLEPCKFVIRYKWENLEARLEQIELDLEKCLVSRRCCRIEEWEIGKHVAVRSPDGEFYRARRGIMVDIDRLENPPCAGIFLYDYGLFRSVEYLSILPLETKLKVDFRPSAQIVMIPGLAPSKVICEASESRCLPSENWSDESIDFVENWTKKGQICLRKGSVVSDVEISGDFYQKGNIKSLSQLLVEGKYALISEPTKWNLCRGKDEETEPCESQESGNLPKATTALSTLQTMQTDRLINDVTLPRNNEGTSALESGSIVSKSVSPPQQNVTPVTTNSCKDSDSTDKLQPERPVPTTRSKPAANRVPESELRPEENKTEKDELCIPMPRPRMSQSFGKLKLKAHCEEKPPASYDHILTTKEPTTTEPNVTAAQCKVLLRGNNFSKPYTQIEDFPLLAHVKKSLEIQCGISRINQLQRFSWPQIMCERNCFIIGGQTGKKGKSLSYLVPVIAKLLSEFESEGKKVESGVGPTTLIICSSINSGVKLKNHLDHLLSRSSIVTYLAIDTGEEREITKRLKDQPEIIITTPEFALRLLEDYYSLFGFDRLRHMVFDDAHYLLKHKLEKVINVIQKLSHHLNLVSPRACNLQTIFCGQEWSEVMREAYLEIPLDPVLIMGSTFQAIILGKVKMLIHFCKSEHKEDKLKGLIESVIRTRCVIVCQSEESVVELGLKLHRSSGVKTVYLPHGDVTSSQISEIKDKWLQTAAEEHTYFVCTDSDLRKFNLQDIECIIHYEMPAGKLEVFGDRHIGMWNLFPDTARAQGSSCDQTKLVSHVFLTPDDEDLPKIVSQFRKIEVEIPEDLIQMTEDISKTELEKTRLCESFVEFGFCYRIGEGDCHYRHHFNSEDVFGPATLKKTGMVEFEIVQCLKVNKYYAKLHYYYESKKSRCEGVISFLDVLKMREEELTKYYSDEKNRIPLPSYNKRNACAIQPNGEGSFTRGVINTVLRYEDGVPVQVRVFCIDTGRYAVRDVKDLYLLPEKFANCTPTCVTVILANVKPLHGVEQFFANDLRKSKILTPDKIFAARIALAFGNHIVVKPMLEFELDESGNAAYRTNIKTELTRSLKVAEDNPEHIQNLYLSFEKCGFNCEHYRAEEACVKDFEKRFSTSTDSLVWSHLEIFSIDRPQLIEVYSNLVVSPHLMYVSQCKFAGLLDELEKSLEKQVVSIMEDEFPDYFTTFINYYEEGMCVVAKNRENSVWNRAIITKILVDPCDCSRVFDVFYVDHGDSDTRLNSLELFPIPKQFVSRLPFQAIALCLNHIIPDKPTTDSTWDQEAVDSLESVFYEQCNQKQLDVTPVKIIRKSDGTTYFPECRYYDAFVFADDRSSNGLVELGEYLVKCKFASYSISQMEGHITEMKKSFLDQTNVMVNSLTIDASSEGAELRANKFMGVDDDDYEVCLGEGPQNFLEMVGLPKDLWEKRGSNKVPETIGQDEDNTNSMEKNQLTPLVCLSPSTLAQEAPSNSTTTKADLDGDETNKSGVASGSSTTGQSKPAVIWLQTKSEVKMRICIPDIKKYSLLIGSDRKSLSFASLDPPNYSFDIDLFGKIHVPPEETVLGQHLLVKMKKLSEGFNWPNITRASSTAGTRSWLKRDLEHISMEDSDEEPLLDDNGGTERDTQGLNKNWVVAKPANYDSDEDDSWDSSTSGDESQIDETALN